MNQLDREIAQIIADHLHEQDPRYVWEPRLTTEQAPAPDPTSTEQQAAPGHQPTPQAGEHRHAA